MKIARPVTSRYCNEFTAPIIRNGYRQAASTVWHGFPDVLIHADESTVKGNVDYLAAKAGDVQAARRLVEATLNEKAVATIAGTLADSNAWIASVHAHEAEGINRIPAVLAEVLAERLGLQAEESVVQINRSGHTGAGGYHRLAHPALFDGEVERNRNYFLVDDFVGQGGTIANLKGFIEIKGGIAILASTLTGKPYSAKLSLEQATLSALRAKHGDKLENWWKETFGYGFEFLTESEARYLERADEAQLIPRSSRCGKTSRQRLKRRDQASDDFVAGSVVARSASLTKRAIVR